MSHRFAALQMFIFCSGSQRARNRQLDVLQYWFARMSSVCESSLPEVRTFFFGIVAQNAQKKTARQCVSVWISCMHTLCMCVWVLLSLFMDHDGISATFPLSTLSFGSKPEAMISPFTLYWLTFLHEYYTYVCMYMYDYGMRSCICECWKAVGKGGFLQGPVDGEFT